MKDTPQTSWMDVGGSNTRIITQGEGEPVIFLHGGMIGASPFDLAEAWSDTIAALAQGHRCIAVDRLGHGHSDVPASDTGYGTEGAFVHLCAAIEALGAGPCHLVGHGFGGFLALLVTLRRRALVRSCTIVGSDAIGRETGREELLMAGLEEQPGTLAFHRAMIARSSYDAAHVTPAWIEAASDAAALGAQREATRRAMGLGLRDVVQFSDLRTAREEVWGELARRAVNRPVLLVWGQDDPVVPVGHGYAALDAIGNRERRCRLQIFNRCGHYPFREQTAQFNRAITTFLEDVRHGA